MKKVIKTIVIPNYIRQVKLSDKQRPIYYYYDKNKRHIRSKKKELLKKYIKNSSYNRIAKNNGRVEPIDLENGYVIALFQANKIIGYYGSTLWVDLKYNLEPDEFLINKTSTQKEIFRKYNVPSSTGVKLTNKQATKPIKSILINYFTKEPVLANSKKAGKPRMDVINGQKMYSQTYNEHTRAKIVNSIKKNLSLYMNDIEPIISYPIGIKIELHDTIKDRLDRTKKGNGRRWDVDNRCYPYMKCFLDLLVEKNIIVDDDRLHVGENYNSFVPISEEHTSKLVFKIYTL